MPCDIFLKMPGGIKMPALGIGTWQSSDDSLEEALETALKTGYRHIDTAQAYGNEEIIGKILKKWFDSGNIKREDVFITTKLAPICLFPDKVEENLKESLRKLQLEYVDLYLIHFPVSIKAGEGPDLCIHYTDVWKKMEEQHDAGLARNIGISNFNKRQVETLLKSCRIKPANNQIELHVYLQQKELVDFCLKNDVTIVAYSPLGCRNYNLFLQQYGNPPRQIRDTIQDETVVKIGKKHSKTPAQVALRFLLQLGVAAIPKSVSSYRIVENFDVFDYELDDEDMASLRALEVGSEARVLTWEIFDKIFDHPEYPF